MGTTLGCYRPLTEALAKSAYTVFIIHPLFLSLAQWSYVVLLRQQGTGVLELAKSNVTFAYAYFIIDGSQASAMHSVPVVVPVFMLHRAQYGMVWYGMVWYRMVGYGMVW